MGVRRNLHPNPACATTTNGNATNWTSTPSGYARQTGVTGMDRTTGFGGSGAYDPVTTPRFAAVAGQQYVASVQVKTGASNTFKMLINWYTGVDSGSFISNSGSATQFVVNGTQRCEIGPFTAPTGAGAGYLRIIEVDNTTATWTAVLVEQTSSTGNTYFDGDTTGATWEGTAGNSTSLLLTGSDAWSGADAGSLQSVSPGPSGSDVGTFSASGSILGSSTVNQDVAWGDGGLIIQLAYDARLGRNRVGAIGLPATAIRAEVSVRPGGRTTFTPVRGGKVAVVSGAFARSVDDYEFAAGAANTYQIRALSSAENTTDIVVAAATATLPPVLDEVWLKFIAAPSFNLRATLVDWGEMSRASRVALYDVQGRSDPVAVTDVHSSRRVTVTLRTATDQQGEQLDHALSQGMPLFLHVPVTVALPSLYAVAGDYSYARPAKLSHARLWTLALTEVAAPSASIVGPATTWQSLIDAYPSWAAVLAAVGTWQDAL